MTIRIFIQCPGCGHEWGVELQGRKVAEAWPRETTPTPKPAPRLAKAKAKEPYCRCGHPKSWHQPNCTHGAETAMGGCPCRAYHTTKRADAYDAPAPAAARIEGNGTLNAYERSLLAVLVQRGPTPTSRAQLALLAGRSLRSSAFDASLARLRSNGFLHGSGSALLPTPAGIRAAGDVPALPRGSALLEHWSSRVGEYASTLLQRFVLAYPRDVTRDELVEATGYSGRSSAFDAALAKLRTLQLVDGWRASSTLMDSVKE